MQLQWLGGDFRDGETSNSPERIDCSFLFMGGLFLHGSNKKTHFYAFTVQIQISINKQVNAKLKDPISRKKLVMTGNFI